MKTIRVTVAPGRVLALPRAIAVAPGGAVRWVRAGDTFDAIEGRATRQRIRMGDLFKATTSVPSSMIETAKMKEESEP